MVHPTGPFCWFVLADGAQVKFFVTAEWGEEPSRIAGIAFTRGTPDAANMPSTAYIGQPPAPSDAYPCIAIHGVPYDAAGAPGSWHN